MGYLSTYAIVSKTAPGNRKLPVWERVYCWFLILLGVAGGLCATVNAVKNIVSSELSVPCYVEAVNITSSGGGH